MLLRAIPLLVRLEIVYICLSADLRRGIMKMLPPQAVDSFSEFADSYDDMISLKRVLAADARTSCSSY